MKRFNRYLALVAAVLALISCQSEKNSYDLIPYPNHIEQIPGRFSFDKGTQIYVSPECGDGVPTHLPVDLYVPGCPPSPWSILDGILSVAWKKRMAG